MDILTLLSFVAAAVLLTFAPGPDVMYLLAKSLAAGTRQGVVLSMGLASGCLFHTTLVACGVAAFIQDNPAAFSALMYLGAAYLLYLAWGAFRAPAADLTLPGAADSFNAFALYRKGLLMNALNPKVLLFFLALLPQFIDKQGSWPPVVQIIVLGVSFAIQALCCFSLIAVCAGKIRDKILRLKNFSLIMNRVEGTILTLIAAALLFME